MHQWKAGKANMSLTHATMRRIVHAIGLGRDPALRSTRKEAALAMQLEHARWWNDRNVVGLCFAAKVRNGRTEDVTLQVHVRRKRRKDRVPEKHRVPPFVMGQGLGCNKKIWTDVREVGLGRLHVLVSPQRPARPGFNIGHQSGGAGTLSCVVVSRQTGERLGLSCGHVIARSGQASPGERVLVPSLDEAQANGWLSSASFGNLVTVGSIGYDANDATTNVDAATVRPDRINMLDDAVALLDATPSGIHNLPALHTPVKKVGSATELTAGTVQAIHWLASLPFDKDDGSKDVWFADLIGISHFAAEGDSGALVLDEQNAAIGIHMGEYKGLSVCAPIQHVLDGVDCDLALP
jgi:hypothetical protein